MSSQASTRPAHAMPGYSTGVAWLIVAACVGMAVYTPLFDRSNCELLGTVLTLAAGALVAAGLLIRGGNARRPARALIVVGAIAGGCFLVWTLVVPLLAILLMVLLARDALNGPFEAATSAN